MLYVCFDLLPQLTLIRLLYYGESLVEVMRLLSFALVYATVLLSAHAFVAPKTERTIRSVGPEKSMHTLPAFHLLAGAKKREDMQSEPSNQLQLDWLSPAKNPYMLFVYPILFIVAVDFFHLGPSAH